MSVTLLEITVAVILVVVAWQIGVIITPWIIHRLRGLKDDLDEVAEEIGTDHLEEVNPNRKEKSGSNNGYRNN
jgi:hypothetical protein